MKKVLITGITGYIGSHLAHALSESSQVYGLVREPVHMEYIADIYDRITLFSYDGSCQSVVKALEASCPDTVYHLAAYYTNSHRPDCIKPLVESNLGLGSFLLEAMCTTGCRKLIYATTVTTHHAADCYRPLTFYAATKQAFSALVEFYTSTGVVNAAAVALSDTYGPGDRRPKVLNLVRQAVIEQTPLELSSGRQIFDLTYIDDVVRAFIGLPELLEQGTHQFFQVSSEKPLTLRETVELLLQSNGLTLHAHWGRRPDPEYQPAQNLHIYPSPPNWRPEVDLETGLQRFWMDTSTVFGGNFHG